jgi:hypothetical protein
VPTDAGIWFVRAVFAQTPNFNAFTTPAAQFEITPIDTRIHDRENQTPITVWVSNGEVHIKGLIHGEWYEIHTVSGTRIRRAIATSDVETVSITTHGIYILRTATRIVKFVK